MRICFIHSENFERFYPFFAYAKALNAIGHNASLCAIHDAEKNELKVREGVQLFMISSTKIKGVRPRIQKFRFLVELRQILKNERFDIMHVCYFPNYFLVPLLMRKQARIFIGDVRTGSLRESYFARKVENAMLAIESSLFHKLLFLDEVIRARIMHSLKKRSSNIIPVGVDCGSSFTITGKERLKRRAKLGINPKDIVCIYCGSLSPLRKLDRLLEVFLPPPAAKIKLKLLVIGEGPDLPMLQQIVKHLAIDERVKFVGFVHHQFLNEYLCLGDIGLAYVPKTEGYDIQPPIKTLEYMACRLPVVATDTLGNRRFIKNEENGIIVGGVVDELREAILALANDPKRRRRYVECSSNVVERYCWDRIVNDKLLPIYKSSLKIR